MHLKDTIQFLTPKSSPGFEPKPYGTAFSVDNHYTGWVTSGSVSFCSTSKGVAELPGLPGYGVQVLLSSAIMPLLYRADEVEAHF
ncbi:hypothetical protein TNCV_4706381 [Trichonephila clavipes]|nr:hypothetical protein TNCV_4706381 [Trichonephila clavipes]